LLIRIKKSDKEKITTTRFDKLLIIGNETIRVNKKDNFAHLGFLIINANTPPRNKV
jgi:hypothetical protein